MAVSSQALSLADTTPTTVVGRPVVCEWIDAYNPTGAVAYVQVRDGSVAATRRPFPIPAGQARPIPVGMQVDDSLVVFASTSRDGTNNPTSPLEVVVTWGPLP